MIKVVKVNLRLNNLKLLNFEILKFRIFAFPTKIEIISTKENLKSKFSSS